MNVLKNLLGFMIAEVGVRVDSRNELDDMLVDLIDTLKHNPCLYKKYRQYNNYLLKYSNENIPSSTKFNIISFISTIVQLDKLYAILTRYKNHEKKKIVKDMFDNIHGDIEDEFVKYAVARSMTDELFKIKIIYHMRHDDMKPLIK